MLILRLPHHAMEELSVPLLYVALLSVLSRSGSNGMEWNVLGSSPPSLLGLTLSLI